MVFTAGKDHRCKGGLPSMRLGPPQPPGTPRAVAGLRASSTAAAGADPAANPIGPACPYYAQEAPTSAGSMAGAPQQPPPVPPPHNTKLSTQNAALSGELNPAV